MTEGLNFSRRRRLPVIRAAEGAECGLVCLAMVANWHGLEITLNALRQIFPPALSGVTLRGLMEQADRLGFASRAARVDLGDLERIALPTILHWRQGHFVVLKSISQSGAVVHDPAEGVRTLNLAALSEVFSGIILELEPGADFRTATVGQRLRLSDLWSSVTGLRSAVLTVAGLSLALQVVAFAIPLQIQFVVDDVLSRGDDSIIWVIALAFATLIVLQSILEGLRAWSIQATAYSALFQVMSNVVRHLTRLPLSWFEARSVGDIMSRLASATTIQDTLTRGVLTALLDGFTALVAAIFLFLYSPQLAFIVTSGVALNFIVTRVLYTPLRSRMQERITASASEQTHLIETVRASATIKTLGREAERVAEWRGRYAKAMNSLASIAKYHAGLQSAQTLINGLQVVLVVAWGAHLVVHGEGLSAGMLIAFLAFRQIFSDRTTTFLNQLIEFRLLGLHLDRLGDIVQSRPEVPVGTVSPSFPALGRLKLTDVGFRYGFSAPEVLESIDVTVETGDFIAITGPSGGGKSTLLKLMIGLLVPTCGKIELEGAAATPERWRHWRTQLGFVSQDDRLLAGSIAENIAFFDPELDMAQVHAVARMVGLDREIGAMPMQYLTRVGDMGSALSSGQKQRIFMARALYGRPSVLVLDEGTANLDEEAETVITNLVLSLPITRIIVAHRPALVEAAQRRFEIRDGHLVEWSTLTGKMSAQSAA